MLAFKFITRGYFNPIQTGGGWGGGGGGGAGLWRPYQTFHKIYLQHFEINITCTSTMTFPWQPIFDSHVLQNLQFSAFLFHIFCSNQHLTRYLALVYQIYDNRNVIKVC